MSAWIVSEVHIDALVQAMISWEMILPADADEIGRTLWLENVASIHARYPDTEVNDRDYPGPINFTKADAEGYQFGIVPGQPDPALVEVAAESYSYQSCEHGGWGASRAKELVGVLIVEAQRRLPEFDRRFGKLPERIHDTHAHAWSLDWRDAFDVAAELRAEHREAATV